jgi:hypothetical protein
MGSRRVGENGYGIRLGGGLSGIGFSLMDEMSWAREELEWD